MRFIRDIIKEKRGDDPGDVKPVSSPIIKAPVEEPLVLKTPVSEPMTDTKAKSNVPGDDAPEAAAPAQKPAEPKLDAPQSPVGSANGTAAEASPAQSVRPRFEDLELPDGVEAEDEEEADILPEADPFQKLRESGQLDAPVRKSVSPMRAAPKAAAPSAPSAYAPSAPAAPMPSRPSETAPGTAPVSSQSKPMEPKPSASAPSAPSATAQSAPKPTPAQKPEPKPEPARTQVAQTELDALKPAADAMEEPVQMPAPAKGRGSARSGRVKTRLLGFSAGSLERSDPFEKKPGTPVEFPVGWLVVVSEKGRGASFSLHDGVTKVGRGTDQTVSLNFGDNSISRDNHVSIAFDSEQNKFFIGHSGKTNLVRVNNVPLLSTEELKSKDLIRLGETTLRFIAFCADDFSWVAEQEKVAKHA